MEMFWDALFIALGFFAGMVIIYGVVFLALVVIAFLCDY